MRSLSRLLFFSVLVGGLSSGCHRTFSASTSQPNPLKQPLDTLRETEVLTIVTGDMELNRPRSQTSPVRVLSQERYPLLNKASFNIVSRDRLRFHVQIQHKWQSYANLRSWKVVLEDDQGNRYSPASVETSKPKHLMETWSREKRTVSRSSRGYITQIHNDAYKDRQTLGNLSVYQGRGDLVFYQRDIFGPEVRSMTLTLERSGVTFKFSWQFADDLPAAVPTLALKGG